MILTLLVLSAEGGILLAYIDPLTGSVVLQVLAAGILAASFTLKNFWNRLATTALQIWKKMSGK